MIGGELISLVTYGSICWNWPSCFSSSMLESVEYKLIETKCCERCARSRDGSSSGRESRVRLNRKNLLLPSWRGEKPSVLLKPLLLRENLNQICFGLPSRSPNFYRVSNLAKPLQSSRRQLL